jgi:hypothetical protein
MPTILFVRIKTSLDAEELENRAKERLPRFRNVRGLVQKFYGRDKATGDACGIYFFEDESALAAFRESELAQTIPAAYEALDVRPEVFELLFPLYPEKGPTLD